MTNMRYVIGLLAFITFMHCDAQIGINYRYQNLNPSLWEEQTKIPNLYNSTHDFGIDYWFRLKNYRVEFSPEVFMTRAKTVEANTNNTFNSIGIATNTNVYIFDFVGDCNCPTFSKDGNLFTKGFYVSVNPTIEFQQNEFQEETVVVQDVSRVVLGIAIGAGVDIGITDLITISPYIRYKYLPSTSWTGDVTSSQLPADPSQKFAMSYPQFGLRLGFRPDYIREQNKFKKRRRRR